MKTAHNSMFALWPGDQLNFSIFIKPTFGFAVQPAASPAGHIANTNVGGHALGRTTKNIKDMGQLKITRLREWANRRFSYKILVDGKEQFEIANGQEKFLTVDNGATLQAKLMWCGSQTVNISAGLGQIKELRVKANKGLNVRFPFFALTV